MKKGLIVKPEWAELILSGQKTMELRGHNTKVRGTIGIIKSKTGQVYGTVDVVDSILLEERSFIQQLPQHKVVCPYKEIPYKKIYGWVLENPILFSVPKPYTHKQGCVIWVNL